MSIQKQVFLDKYRIDCKQCCGLCCTALYFSKLDGFPEDKEAGRPCSKLQNNFLCAIHDELHTQGLKGCLSYDCLGAGQYVTHLYKMWKEKGHTFLQEEMYQAFKKCEQLHQISWYLYCAYQTKEASQHYDRIENWLQEIEEIKDVPSLMSFPLVPFQDGVNQFLKQLIFRIANTPNNHHAYIGHQFHGRRLDSYDFAMKTAIGADFSNCSLKKTIFLGTDLRGAKFYNCDLRTSYFLTQGQLNSMEGNQLTLIPSHLKKPSTW